MRTYFQREQLLNSTISFFGILSNEYHTRKYVRCQVRIHGDKPHFAASFYKNHTAGIDKQGGFAYNEVWSKKKRYCEKALKMQNEKERTNFDAAFMENTD